MNRRTRRLLSARNLDDVPPPVRIGSPADASDYEVRRFASLGLIHGQANYGVVYRVAFKPVLLDQENEQPLSTPQGAAVDGMPQGLTMRFGNVRSGRLRREGDRTVFGVADEAEGTGWILATTLGVRWHFPEDGIPALDLGKEHIWGRAGYRCALYRDLLGASQQPQTVNLAGVPIAADVVFLWHLLQGVEVLHMIAFDGQGSAENQEWFDWMCQVARSHNASFREGYVGLVQG